MRYFMILFLLAILSLSGCGAGRVKVVTDGTVTCSGGYAIFGAGTGPCGVTGAAISTGAAELAGKVIGQAMTFIPGVSPPNPAPPPVVIQHQDSKSEPLQSGPPAVHETSEVKPWQLGPAGAILLDD